jgi:DNA-binding PadR family transcriptional regulator
MGGGSFIGEFEQVVLLAVARLDDAYGMTVRREIERQTGRDVSIGSVYITLDRLLAKGYVAEHPGDPTPTRGGRSRRLFTLTKAGAAVLETARATQEAMWRGVNLKAATRRR